MYAGRAWASSWHHTSRNSCQEPSRYLVATVGFPTRSGLCQELLPGIHLILFHWRERDEIDSIAPSLYISKIQWTEASWVTPRHLAVPSRMYIFGREMSKLLLSASRKVFWLPLRLSMLEIKRESVARKRRQLQGPINCIPLSLGSFPTAFSCLFHTVTGCPPLSL